MIETNKISKEIGDTRIVDSIDMLVEPGQIVGLIGPNGAGKTTLLRMILGLVRPTTGEARILGERVPTGPRTLAAIGSAIEEPAFYPWMSGRANLETILAQGAPVPHGALERVLERVDLASAARNRVKTYSQGMRQRLALAVALARNPKALVLDEPTNGLDPLGMAWLRELVKEMRDAGTAVLVSSHLLHDVEQVCDRITMLYRGRVVAEGTPQRLVPPGTSLEQRFMELVEESDAAAAG